MSEAEATASPVAGRDGAQTGDRMTTLDAAFLWFERPGVPLQLGGVAIFEGAPLCDAQGRLRLDELRRRAEGRLDVLPRLRRRLVDVPLGLDRPRWVDDTEFDITRHVDAVELPAPGDETALREMAEQLHMQPLDRDRPLWHLRFVTGLTGGRVAVIERIHHSLVDGVSGVDAMAILLDLVPDTPLEPPERWEPRPTPWPFELAADALRDRWLDLGRVARLAAGAVLRPADLLRSASAVASGLASIVRQGVQAPSTPFTTPPGPDRRFAWIRAPFRAANETGKQVGGTVNDVVLSAVAGGLRDLLLERGEALWHDLAPKALVPVSVRSEEQRGTLGNRLGSLFAPLPVGIGDPERRLAQIVATTRALKEGTQAATTQLVLRAADALPPSLGRVVVRAIEHQPLINLVVTNVPGPPVPLYALGARMLVAYPIVPLGANLSLNVAALSYDGQLAIGITADPARLPDLDTFTAGLARGFEQLGVPAAPVG